MGNKMKAAVSTKAGNPGVIEIMEVPKPEIKAGWVLLENADFF